MAKPSSIIHPTAIVEDGAKIGNSVKLDPIVVLDQQLRWMIMLF